MQDKVLINGRFVRDRMIGLSRYIVEIAKRLNSHTELLTPPKFGNFLHGIAWEQTWLLYKALNYPLLWSPANSGPLFASKQVVTIHDVIPLDHPEWFRRSYHLFYRTMQPVLCKNARKIITDSSFSKSRILSVFNIPDNQVVVIHPGVGENFTPAVVSQIENILTKYLINQPYLFVLGSLEPRKNLGRLFTAWQRIQPKFPEFELVVAGLKAGSALETGFTTIPKGVKLIGYVEQDELTSLYSGSIAHVFPSIYEGFGLTVLEAMACGAPVVASNATSIPEAVGEAGLLFDPFDIEAMAAALNRVIMDADLRSTLRRKGLEHARRFTWEQTAQGVWGVLQEAMQP